MRRQSASPAQSAQNHLTPQSVREQRLQPRDSVDMGQLPSEETLISITPETMTTPTDVFSKPPMNETNSVGLATGSVGCISEPLLVQKDLPNGVSSPRSADMSPQKGLPVPAQRNTLCQPEDVTVEPE